jgi:prevent-host-death family protein
MSGTVGTVSIRDLSRNASAVIDGVSASGKPTLVTKHGKPVAAVIPIDDADVEDLILAKASEYAEDLAEAEAELAAGKTRPASEVFAALGF